MSSAGPQRPPRTGVIRRGIRKPTIIALPQAVEAPGPPHAGKHAKTFVTALALVIVAAAVLLATPWTTESGEATPPIDALFTAISAVSVTGLITVDTATHWNLFGEVIILALIQIGGLGFMVGASIILLILRRGANRLSDVLLVREGGPTISLREAVTLSKHIALFTLAGEAIGTVVLTLCFWQDMPLSQAAWFGLFHAISAFCNAGFDLQGHFTSLTAYQGSVEINVTIMLLIQAGALSYMVLADAATSRRWKKLAVDSKLVLLINGALVAAGMLIFLVIEWGGVLAEVPGAVRPLASLFQSVTARSGGFTTVDFGDVQAGTLFIWMALMFIGGASGSTAGGVKLATVGVIAAAIFSTVKGDEEVQIFGRRMRTPLVFRAMAVIAIVLLVHFVATALLVATQGWFQGNEIAFVALMFEAMSAMTTTGLSTGITPDFTIPGKLILCVVMFLGRLGPLTVVYALQQRQQPTPLRFPVTSVRIG